MLLLVTRYFTILALTAAVTLLAPQDAHAQSTVPAKVPSLEQAAHQQAGSSPFSLQAYWENDSSLLKPQNPTDRHYTNGVLINFGYQPQWAQSLAPHMPFAESFAPEAHTRTAAGFVLGHHIYTPDDITIPTALPDEQPYAGYLYAGAYWQRDNALDPTARVATLDHFQVDLGFIGPSTLAEDTQKWIHETFSGDDPRGWQFQLSDEPTIQTYFRKKWRIDAFSTELAGLPLDAQIIPQLEGAAGTVFVHGQAGVLARVGVNLPDDFGPAFINDLPSMTGLTATRGIETSRWRGYAFTGVSGRAVAHNLFLEGNNYEDSLGVEPEPFVGQLRLGLWLAYETDAWAIDFQYAQTFETSEFEGQSAADSYGTLMLAWRYSY